MVYGVMPSGGSLSGSASSRRRWVMALFLLSALQRLEAAGGGASSTSPSPDLNNSARGGCCALAWLASDSSLSGVHGGRGWREERGSGSGGGGMLDLEPLHAGSSVDSRFLCFSVCRGSWWAFCYRGITQMRWNLLAAGKLLHLTGLVPCDFDLAGRGVEEIGIEDVASWADGDASVQRKHQDGNSYMAGASSSIELDRFMSGCYARHCLQSTGHEVCASLLLGTCRRWVRAPLLRIPRFSDKDSP